MANQFSRLSDKFLPYVVGPDAPRRWLIVIWYACLTYGLVYAIHFWMWSEGTSQSITDMMATHERIVTGTDVAPVQYRYVAYALPEWLHNSLGISVSAGYGLIRLVFTFLSALLFHWYLGHWFDWQLSVIGVMTLLVSLPLTTTQKDLQPTDMPSLVFLLLALLTIQKQRTEWLLLIVPVAMLFRETAFYQLVAWAALIAGQKLQRREIVLFGMTTVLTLAVYLGLRFYFGYLPYGADLITIKGNLQRVNTFGETFFILNIFWIIGWLGLRDAPTFMRRSLVLVPVVLLTVWGIGNPAESRLWLPLFPVLIPLGLFVLSNRKPTLASSTVS